MEAYLKTKNADVKISSDDIHWFSRIPLFNLNLFLFVIRNGYSPINTQNSILRSFIFD
jgi:hypothetical protein